MLQACLAGNTGLPAAGEKDQIPKHGTIAKKKWFSRSLFPDCRVIYKPSRPM
jgi:hypothetical protein